MQPSIHHTAQNLSQDLADLENLIETDDALQDMDDPEDTATHEGQALYLARRARSYITALAEAARSGETIPPAAWDQLLAP